MIQSMTAFARGDSAVDNGSLSWEIRTVNHRYLDMALRLPEGFRSLENDLKEVVRQSLSRGKVDATLRFDHLRKVMCNPLRKVQRLCQWLKF